VTCRGGQRSLLKRQSRERTIEAEEGTGGQTSGKENGGRVFAPPDQEGRSQRSTVGAFTEIRLPFLSNRWKNLVRNMTSAGRKKAVRAKRPEKAEGGAGSHVRRIKGKGRKSKKKRKPVTPRMGEGVELLGRREALPGEIISRKWGPTCICTQ